MISYFGFNFDRKSNLYVSLFFKPPFRMHLTNGPILKNETQTSKTCQRSHKSLFKKLFSNDHKHLDKMWSSKTRTFKVRFL